MLFARQLGVDPRYPKCVKFEPTSRDVVRIALLIVVYEQHLTLHENLDRSGFRKSTPSIGAGNENGACTFTFVI